jgi:hypothetical protein
MQCGIPHVHGYLPLLTRRQAKRAITLLLSIKPDEGSNELFA